MVEWKKYQCTGTQHPLHHGISPEAAFSITPYCADYQSYSDDEIWALLWDLFGPDSPSALKALFRDVATLLFVLVDNLPLSPSSCQSVRGFAAVVSTIVTHLSPQIQCSVEELSKLFLSCLPPSFSTPIKDYVTRTRPQPWRAVTFIGRKHGT